MSDIINILPDNVANQIAAGEVVDRPASAVKELIENAIDAGASTIQLIVKDAGRTLIQVIDNGCGMSDSDARLCFERHATSKIHQADDLFAIRTMGFRGEALASIAAIAQVELKTRMHDEELGTCVEIEGCTIKSQQPCSCAPGTSFSVKNLFFNVPARRNFLKKDSIELSHIEEVFRRIVMTHCDISFSFHSNGKLLYDLHACNMLQRICQIFGQQYAERLYPVDEISDVVTVKGYVGKPEYVRKTRGEQYLFVNGRYIKHPALSAAVERAYTNLIPDRLYPSYFLTLSVDPSRIDVNIHPTKTEVKFVDEQAMFAILRAAARKAIGQFSLATEIEFNPSTEIRFDEIPPVSNNYTPPIPTINYTPNYNPFNETPSNGSKSAGGRPRQSDKWESFYGSSKKESSIEAELPIEAPEETTANELPSDMVCLQVKNRYIACATQAGLLLIDQQRAHERIIYERFANAENDLPAQQLMFPLNFTLSPADSDLLGELVDDLHHNGFAIERMDNSNTFVVTATPADFDENDLQGFFEEMVTDYKGCMMQKFGDRNHSLCRSIARRMAVKSGRELKSQEMQQIVADLMKCSSPALSPDGDPVIAIVNEERLANILKGKI